MDRLNIARVDTLPTFLETLKVLHVTGPLPNNRIASISCSGGEASLAADISVDHNVCFPALNDTQKTNLREALGPMVALANPLDYHTYIWRDTDAMTKAWAAMMDPSLALTMLIVDFPRADRCDPSDWECAIQAALNAKAQSGANVAMVATLPELMPEDVAARLMQGGVIPINGLKEAIAAAEAASGFQTGLQNDPLLLPGPARQEQVLAEADAKAALKTFGVQSPRNGRATSAAEAASKAIDIGFPLVLKGEGIAHKTEAGAVALNLESGADVLRAAEAMPTESFLVEEMITDVVAELLVGVVRDPAHGYVLTIGAGGVLTELLQDSQSLLIPSSADQISKAVQRLKIAKVINGYRGKPAADLPAIVQAILGIQDYVLANADGLAEIEINPLLCTTDRAVAADALLRFG